MNRIANASDKALKMDRSTLVRTLSLVNLAPEVVQAIFNGKAPMELTLEKVSYGFPDDWEEQKNAFGIEVNPTQETAESRDKN